jgi:hypothetical protein
LANLKAEGSELTRVKLKKEKKKISLKKQLTILFEIYGIRRNASTCLSSGFTHKTLEGILFYCTSTVYEG